VRERGKYSLTLYKEKFKRFFIIILLAALYTASGLAIEIFFIIKKSQQYLLEFSLADSYILLGNPFILAFAVALPYFVVSRFYASIFIEKWEKTDFMVQTIFLDFSDKFIMDLSYGYHYFLLIETFYYLLD